VPTVCPTGRSLLPRYDHVLMARFRFMVIDEDGQRIGRFESGDPNWRAGDTFTLDEQLLRILEILPEVSTMVAYNDRTPFFGPWVMRVLVGCRSCSGGRTRRVSGSSTIGGVGSG